MTCTRCTARAAAVLREAAQRSCGAFRSRLVSTPVDYACIYYGQDDGLMTLGSANSIQALLWWEVHCGISLVWRLFQLFYQDDSTAEPTLLCLALLFTVSTGMLERIA